MQPMTQFGVQGDIPDMPASLDHTSMAGEHEQIGFGSSQVEGHAWLHH
jgi:hypothetical protein